MTRKPAEARGSICLCQEYQNSGKPWRRRTTGASSRPAATAWSSIGPLRKFKCSRANGTGAEFTLETEDCGNGSKLRAGKAVNPFVEGNSRFRVRGLRREGVR